MSIAFPTRRPDPSQIIKDAGFRQDLNVRLNCPDCKSSQLVEEFSSGDLVCGNCGLVVGDRVIDTRSEWRTFAGDEGDDPSRVGGPSNPLLNGVEKFETVISFKDGHSGAAKDLNRAATRAAGGKSGDKAMGIVFRAIQDMCDTISLPKTVSDIAKQLYRRSEEQKLLRGKQGDAIVAACIFIACRQANVGRSFKEIVALTQVPKKAIAGCFKILSQNFEMSTIGGGGAFNSETGEANGAGAEALVGRFCNHLGLSYQIQKAAYAVAMKQRDLGVLAGRSPISVAAACIYFTSALYGSPKSAREISKVVGVSEVTVRIAYKLLLGAKEQVVEPEAITSRTAKLECLPTA